MVHVTWDLHLHWTDTEYSTETGVAGVPGEAKLSWLMLPLSRLLMSLPCPPQPLASSLPEAQC